MPALMEALQMLKFWLKKERLDFTKGWATPEADMLINEDNSHLLGRLFASDDKDFCDVLGVIGREEGDGISDKIPCLYWCFLNAILQQ